jgi:taurine transport system substrate-binding protein
MKPNLKGLVLGLVASALFAGTASAEKIIIGHFGNPTPMQLLASSDAVEKATG